jgi:hypothetical protein
MNYPNESMDVRDYRVVSNKQKKTLKIKKR